jgi:hypothetical protein
MAYEENPEHTLRDGADHLTNEARTCEPSDARLTQRRSRRVRKYPATPEQRGLIAVRAAVGGDTPVGHRCSTGVGQIANYPKATPLARHYLKKLMRQTHDDLARLTSR